MVWVRLDDKFHSNAKMEAAGNAARGLYCSALSYCGDHLTDGFVAAAWAKKAGTKIERDKLTRIGAWKPVTAGETVMVHAREKNRDYEHMLTAPADGYVILDYLVFNPSNENVAKKRRETADRVANWRDGKKPDSRRSNAVGNGVRNSVSNAAPDPDPKDQKPSRTRARQNPTPPTQDETDRPYQCTECTIRCKTTRELRDHLDNVHWLEGDQLAKALVQAGAT